MKQQFPKWFKWVLFFTFLVQIKGTSQNSINQIYDIQLPYHSLGWTDEEAAKYVLNRLAFGPTQGQIKEVVQQGVEQWILQQFNGVKEPRFESRLKKEFPALNLSIKEINATYPSPAVRFIIAGIRNHLTRYRDGKLIDSLKVNEMLGTAVRQAVNVKRTDDRDFPGYAIYEKLTRKYDFKDFNSLMYQLMAQKMMRAIDSENQLKEVLVDFWFNHFNVSITRINDVGPQVLAYERDAIRPYVLGNFADLLKATARHPAMLIYLDNNRSNADEGVTTLVKYRESRFSKKMAEGDLKAFAQTPGVNENYARELLELHTLGVDGGYTQEDVEEVARVFTGWKASPFMFPYAKAVLKLAEWAVKGKKYVVLEDGFYFDPQRHDATPKNVLDHQFDGKKGVEEGEKVLELLVRHPSTAGHISRKLAQYFVADTPPPTLVEKMAIAFQASDGNIKMVLKTMLEAPEFWIKNDGNKLKSPFEFIASSVRAIDADIQDPIELSRWCTRMGQPLYAYQAPTGYPDETAFWTNGTGMLKRMDFALQLANNQIKGISYDPSSIHAKIHFLLLKDATETFEYLEKTAETPEEKIGYLLGSPLFQFQ